MAKGMDQQELAVKSGHWPLYRFDPRLKKEGKNPFQLDSKAPSVPLKEYIYNENRYRILQRMKPDAAGRFLKEAQEIINRRWKQMEHMAADEETDEASAPRAPKKAAPSKPPGFKPAAVPPPAGKPKKGKLPPGF